MADATVSSDSTALQAALADAVARELENPTGSRLAAATVPVGDLYAPGAQETLGAAVAAVQESARTRPDQSA